MSTLSRLGITREYLRNFLAMFPNKTISTNDVEGFLRDFIRYQNPRFENAAIIIRGYDATTPLHMVIWGDENANGLTSTPTVQTNLPFWVNYIKQIFAEYPKTRMRYSTFLKIGEEYVMRRTTTPKPKNNPTNAQIRRILTKPKFYEYLTSHPRKTATVGSALSCPIAHYLKDTLHVNSVSVPGDVEDYIEIGNGKVRETQYYPMPSWALNFVTRFDES